MQTRYHNYKRGLISIDENQRLLGIIKSGRYAGFDTMANISGLSCEINHTQTGIQKTKLDLTQTPLTGVFVTPQGTIINEDAAINVVFDTNSGNAQSRADLIIYSHNHVTTPGGANALLSIIKGPIGSFVLPALPNPATQTIIGVMVLPPNATNLSGAKYLPSTAPGIKNRIVEMYSGSAATIPAGYTLCNGIGTDSKLNPIPDLRDRFIVGYNPADTDYNTVGKLGPKVPISGDPEFVGYEVIDLGKKIKQKAGSVGSHKHFTQFNYDDWVEISNDWKSGGDPSPGNGTGGATNVSATGITGLNLYPSGPGGIEVTEPIAMENRPPFYTMAFIVPI